MDICEREIDFLWVLVRNSDELDVDAAPFQPRFLLQEIIFAHSPHFSQPRSQRNLLCRADLVSLRGIAGCECAILPIREIAYSTRSVCEQASPGERATALRSLPATEPVNKFVGSQQKASNTFDRRGETTNSMQTLCHSSPGSYSSCLSLLNVGISLAHPSEETS